MNLESNSFNGWAQNALFENILCEAQMKDEQGWILALQKFNWMG